MVGFYGDYFASVVGGVVCGVLCGTGYCVLTLFIVLGVYYCECCLNVWCCVCFFIFSFLFLVFVNPGDEEGGCVFILLTHDIVSLIELVLICCMVFVFG